MSIIASSPRGQCHPFFNGDVRIFARMEYKKYTNGSHHNKHDSESRDYNHAGFRTDKISDDRPGPKPDYSPQIQSRESGHANWHGDIFRIFSKEKRTDRVQTLGGEKT